VALHPSGQYGRSLNGQTAMKGVRRAAVMGRHWSPRCEGRRRVDTCGDQVTALVRTRVGGDGVARVGLDSPETRNALSDPMLDQLLGALQSVAADDRVRVVVIESTHDRVFSAGGDLKAFAGDTPPIHKHAGLDRFPRLFRLLGGMGKPVVAAAGGDVLAGALGLVLACDLVVAKSSARFGCPEINVGVFPFMVSALLHRAVPRTTANELMMLGSPITAQRAYEIGIANRVVPDGEFDAAVDEWAAALAAKSPLLMQMGKHAVAATRDVPLEPALAALQGQLALALTSDDVVEGVSAFREKRPPRWNRR